ncbi:MAG: hypothetical protein KDA47_03360, partial [Planctomycetales bacterium]|nr:hypothetical protein [Planctomycetales bacterium]
MDSAVGFGSINCSHGIVANGSPRNPARRHDHTASKTEQQIVRAPFPTQDVTEENDAAEPITFRQHLRPRTHLDQRRQSKRTSTPNRFTNEAYRPRNNHRREDKTEPNDLAARTTCQTSSFFFVRAPMCESGYPGERRDHLV